MEAVCQTPPATRFEQLRFAQEILRIEGQAILDVASRLPNEFCDAVQLLRECTGTVTVTGMGKAGLMGQKIAATLASTGTRSQYLHPGEAVHGDLGRVQPGDVVLALSFSGETEELLRLLATFQQLKTPLIAVTSHVGSTLARSATVTLPLGPLREACPHGLAPSTSTTVMAALGDALALVVSWLRNFGPADFARNHPGGNLGRQLAHVEDVMRGLTDCRIAADSQTIREVLVMASKPGRRTGAIMLVDEHGVLTGLFTDSDLARLLERRREAALDEPIRQVMTASPATVARGSLMTEAVGLLVQRKISELPVVDSQGRPAGLIDITDVVAWLPQSPELPALTDASAADDSTLPKTIPFPNRSPRQSRR